MRKFLKPAICVLMALVLCVAGLAVAQNKPADNVKKVPVKSSSAASGEEMYKQYCAVCHGKDGKGNGPAAIELKQAPPDLTTLAKRHDGKFPDDYVSSVLRFGAKAPAHGTADMPVWGPLFASVSDSDNAKVQLRISNLSRYLKGLQQK
jgi:mono/diheme cytochrome c family protein